MAIQADLGPPISPPLPLQPSLKPPSLAVHNNYSFGHSSYQNNTNSNNHSNNLNSAPSQHSRQHNPPRNHRNNHHRQHVYQQRHPAVYSPYPSIVPYGRLRPAATTKTTTTLQGTTPISAQPLTLPGTAITTTQLISTTSRNNAPLPQIPVSTTPTKTSRRPKQQKQQQQQSPRVAAAPPTPPGAVAQPQQQQRRAQPAAARTPRPPPPAHRRIRYQQHHASRASARSELTSLTSGPLNNSLLQMMSETLMLTWPQKCVLAMSKERYLASSPSVAHQVFRSYYDGRDNDDDDWRGGADGHDDGGSDDAEAGTVTASGLPSPPPEQDDLQFDFRYQHDDGDEMAMTTAFSAAAADPYHHQHYHEQEQAQEIAARHSDVGEVSSLSSEEPSPDLMNLAPTSNDHVTAGEVSSASSPSIIPSPKPLALPTRPTPMTTTMPKIPNRQQHHKRKPSIPRAPPTSTLISDLTVGAAVFRIDVRSQRPTILLLKKRAPLTAWASSPHGLGGPASGPPSPYQQHHPPHHYNRPFLEQLPRHLLPPPHPDPNHHQNDHDNDSFGRSATDRSSSLGQQGPSPPVWELPSGRVEDGDYCISDAIARCVKRLTSLNVVRISSMLRETTANPNNDNNGSRQQNVNYDPLRALPRGAAFASAGGSLAGGSVRFLDEEGWPDLTSPQPKDNLQLQLNWTVLVANVEDVVLKGVEHEEFVWANWNVLDMLNLSSATREVAKEALEWAGRCSF